MRRPFSKFCSSLVNARHFSASETDVCHANGSKMADLSPVCRGQKHQRRSKQQQLMEASAEIATSSVDVLLGDEEHDSAPLPPANVPPASGALMQHNSVPLRSPFEAFEPSQPQPQPFSPIPSQGPLGGKTVRFSGNLESFIKEPEAGEHSVPTLLNRYR